MGRQNKIGKWKYYSPKFEFTSELPTESSAWSGHYFFAYDLVSNIKPKVIVELGTHKGNSLFSFAQAIKDNKLDTKLHGVDTWEGEKHAGYYDESVYESFLKITKEYYKDVDIVPHKMYFDNAVKEFRDNSIDILHIDGLHTYEAVKHDFETWLPKVNKDTGIILFHDVVEKKEDFGVYKLWEELQRKYKTITFMHYHGLGVMFLNKRVFDNIERNLDAWYKLYSELSNKQDLEDEILNQQLLNLHNIDTLQETINKLQQTLYIAQAEINEYKSFQQSIIWRVLKLWRKIKTMIWNNIFKRVIDIVKRIFSYLLHAPEILSKYSFDELKQRTFVALKYIRYSEFNRDYQLVLIQNRLTEKEIEAIKNEIKNFKQKPLISIVMPVYNVDIKWLDLAIKSIESQLYESWELCIADDKSTDKRIRPFLEEKCRGNTKIKVVFREKNGHISEATNSALQIATGDYIALMDNDDEIYTQALYRIVKSINEYPNAGLIYSDEDKIEINGTRVDPIFKPDYSSDYLLSTNYISHFSVLKKDIIDRIGGFRKGYEGSQDYDLFLRAVEHTNSVIHIDDVLYGWRKIPGSTATKYDEKGYAEKASFMALEDTVKRRNIRGTVMRGIQPGFFRIRYIIDQNPKVSIVVQTNKDISSISQYIKENTIYKNIEVLKTTDIAKLPKTDSEYIVLFNENCEIKNTDWIENFLEHSQRKSILAVSGKIFDNKKQILCTGFDTNSRGTMVNLHRTLPPHMQNRANLIKGEKILPAICVMIKKENFSKVEIFKSKKYTFYFLKSKDKKSSLLYTPFTEVIYNT